MKTNLRPCPFCGKKRHLRFEPFEGCTDTGIVVCICGASYTTIEQGADWNTRPIEDDLRNRIAELEAESERFTAHSDIGWQDNKSPNDTQTQTFVYGKEDSEVQE